MLDESYANFRYWQVNQQSFKQTQQVKKSGATHGLARVNDLRRNFRSAANAKFHRSLPLGQSAICKEGGTFHLERFMA